MKVKIVDVNKNSYLYELIIKSKNIFDVYAIIKTKEERNKQFLVVIGDIPIYIDLKNIAMLDDTIPHNWIFRSYEKDFCISENYDLFGSECINIKEYYGPSILIENNKFLLYVSTYPKRALAFLKSTGLMTSKKNELLR